MLLQTSLVKTIYEGRPVTYCLDFTIMLTNDIVSAIFHTSLQHITHAILHLVSISGGIIALGVFGGFVFLAAIITTIVILIRR